MLMRLPGSGQWVRIWDGDGFSGAPCYLAGGNTARALVQSWKARCQKPDWNEIEVMP